MFMNNKYIVNVVYTTDVAAKSLIKCGRAPELQSCWEEAEQGVVAFSLDVPPNYERVFTVS